MKIGIALFIIFSVILLGSLARAQDSRHISSETDAYQSKINAPLTSEESASEEDSSLMFVISDFDASDDDAVLGNLNAPVTMVMFGGFWEPFSYNFYIDTFPQIKSQYIDTGKVRFVFRDYPIESLNPLDPLAAEAAECVGEQGGDVAYFQMWNSLFSSLDEPSYDLYIQLASNLGYNIRSCLDSGQMTLEVDNDIVDGDSLGLSGSPTFFVNDQIIEGAYPYEVFQATIEQELNESIACNTNLECNDSNTHTFDTCLNPGQLNAVCQHQPIACLRNSECGSNNVSKFCSVDNKICTRTKSFTCVSPGTPQSSCAQSQSDSCVACPSGCNNQTLMCVTPPGIVIYSPLNNSFHNTKAIQINLTSNTTFNEIFYYDWAENNARWNSLCKNCKEYGFSKKSTKNFDEGSHNVTFKGVFSNINVTKNVSFFVDSKLPKISKVLPKANSFTNGSNFYIMYIEDNCKTLGLNIYPVNSGSGSGGGGSSCQSGKDIEKFISQNLVSYNNQEIEYQFFVRDVSNNSAESKRTKVKVDTTKPVIKSFNYSSSGKKVNFNFNVTEINFEKIEYTDFADSNPKTIKLCTKLKNGICSATKSFKTGAHNLSFFVSDKAGNSVSRNLAFTCGQNNCSI